MKRKENEMKKRKEKKRKMDRFLLRTQTQTKVKELQFLRKRSFSDQLLDHRQRARERFLRIFIPLLVVLVCRRIILLLNFLSETGRGRHEQANAKQSGEAEKEINNFLSKRTNSFADKRKRNF